MSTIKNVAILGASGTLGRVLAPALIQAGFLVTSVVRQESKSPTYPGITVKIADYGDAASLAAAFEGQHAIVEAFNPAAAANQALIVEASIAAGVAHLITPDFSSDTFNPHVDELLIFEPKERAQHELERLVAQSGGAITWTAIIIGVWYDWAIENGQFWIDRKTRTITRFGSGDQKYNISRLALNGDALVAVLRDPDQFRNRPAYFASHTVSTNQLIAMLREIGGEEWSVIDVSLDGFVDKARDLWEQDTAKGVTDRLKTQAYLMLGTAGYFDETNRYGADFGNKLEPGWDEGLEILRDNLKKLL